MICRPMPGMLEEDLPGITIVVNLTLKGRTSISRDLVEIVEILALEAPTSKIFFALECSTVLIVA